MFPFAHVGYAFLAVEITSIFLCFINKLRKFELKTNIWSIRCVSFYALLIGSLGPDIIDKAISFPITGHGRYIAHSILFALGIFIAIMALFRKNKRIWIGFIVGWLMHLILDVGGFMPWLFPFVSYDFPVRILTYLEMFQQSSVYLNEIIGALILVLIVILYLRRKLSFKVLLKEDLSKQPSFLQYTDRIGKDI
ncbi:MAG: metal-dependent hydrolase [Candidatus Heimdallarchaeota archaeon]|nr:metal-dependent hydrolase [Candidatus Heimdallarchaeota archaeon]